MLCSHYMKEIQYYNLKLIPAAKSKDIQLSNWILTHQEHENMLF